MFNTFKITNTTGQRANMRACTLQATIDEGVMYAQETYRMHRLAYHHLAGPGEWEKTLQVLRDEDVKGLGRHLLEEAKAANIQQVRDFVRMRNNGVASG